MNLLVQLINDGYTKRIDKIKDVIFININSSLDNNYSQLSYCCNNNYLFVAKWLYNRYNFKDYHLEFIFTGCENIKILKWLISTTKIRYNTISYLSYTCH